MIIRAHRFHGYNALKHVYSRGQTARGPLIAIKYLSNPSRGSYRASVVVSRKVHKSAVVRNRIRRRIYEIIRGQESSMGKPYDIVITVFSEQIASMEATGLQLSIVSQLSKAGIIGTDQATGGAHSVTKAEPRGIVDAKEHA